MSRNTIIGDIPGGAALCQWFGHVPIFHDAELHGLTLVPGQPCELRLHAFRITNAVESCGRFVTDRHATVTITCEKVVDVALHEFEFPLPAILSDLVVTREDDHLRVAWQSVYGVDGALRAKSVLVDHRPSEPAGCPA